MMNREHRAAISLNNTGVNLLHRGCYRQGMRTLSDAVAVMNVAFKRIKEHHQRVCETPAATRLSLDTMLQQAAQRLARPEPASIQYDLQVLSDYENLNVLQEPPCSSAAPTTSSTNNRAYLLRIEGLDCEASTKQHYESESSIILLNFGLGYQCMVGVTDDIIIKHELQVGAMNLFHLSYTILSASCESQEAVELEDTELRRVVLAATLVLRNLVELSQVLGLPQHGEEYSSRLVHLRSSTKDLQNDEWGLVESAAGAA